VVALVEDDGLVGPV
jgi:hypothetical protein